MIPFFSKSCCLGFTTGLGVLSLLVVPERAPAQSILYICGDQKGNAGIAFDHGLIDYIASEYAGGTVTPTLSSDTGVPSLQGLYDPDDPSMTQTYDFNTFDCVIMSSTVVNHYVAQLITDLKATTTSLLVMNEESLVDLRMAENTVSFSTTDSVFDGTAQVVVTNYPGNSVLSFGDYFPEAAATAWEDAAANAGGTRGFFFSYDEGVTVDAADVPYTMAGDRIFLGLSEGENIPGTPSGVWADTIVNGIVDDSENFDPNTQLTAAGKTMLDQALSLHVVPEAGTTTLSLLTILLVGGRRRRPQA